MTPRPAPRAVPPRDLASLQRAICARARDFEISALLDLLATMGYRPGDVYFRGHVTETPEPTLVHHIEFADLEGELAGPASGGPSVDLGNLTGLAGPASSGPSVDLGSLTELAAASSPPGPPGPRRRPRAGGPTPPVTVTRRPRIGGQASPVTVTVNLGLLSCRSPLPSYFQRLLRDPALQEPLVELLQIIDRNLLRARLTCDRPERIVGQWDEITSDLVRIHGLDSLVGLSWLFRHVFPELPAIVARTSDELRVPYASARLGFFALGSACLGASTRIDVHDFQVTLRVGESLLRPGVPWLYEVDRRLRTIVFPALEPVSMNLTVVLELADDRAVAMLRDDRAPPRESYLGTDPLGVAGSPGPSGAPARKVVLYCGLLPRHQPDTDELERALAGQARVTVTAARAGGSSVTDGDVEDTQVYGAPSVGEPSGGTPSGGTPSGGTPAGGTPSSDCELTLTLDLGGHVHRYHAAVRWGARAWFRDEPYAIELSYDHLPQAAPTARHHPQLWSLLRDRARRSLSSALAIATLVHYGVTSVTDAMVADLIARGQVAALHALLGNGAAGDVPREAWERFVQAQPL